MTAPELPAVWWSPEYQRFYALPGTPPLVEEVETRFMPSDIRPLVLDTGQAPTEALTAGLLRAAAAGRREYAGPEQEHGSGNDRVDEMRDVLLTQAATLDAAAKIAEGNLTPLYGWLPSWRWTPEMDRLVRTGTSASIGVPDVAGLTSSAGVPAPAESTDEPVRTIAAAEATCRAAGLHREGEYGPWLSDDGRIGVGVARLGDMYLGAGVSLVLDREAEREQQIAKIERGAPASLLRAAIESARALAARSPQPATEEGTAGR